MNVNDLVNGCFEIAGGLFNFINIARVYRDKQVRGISPTVIFFFTSWTVWNIYYYPSLHQMISFGGALLMGTSNVVYLSMLLYYSWKEKRRA
jgi:uncharacterized membrane protein YfcA